MALLNRLHSLHARAGSSPLAAFARISTSPLAHQAQAAETAAVESPSARAGLQPAFGRCKKRDIRASPQKLNMLCRQIRGMRASDALLQMQFSPKRKAGVVGQVLNNACNLADIALDDREITPADLRVSQAYVTKAFTLKKVAFHSKGRNGVKHRRWSHVTVEVEEIDWEQQLRDAMDAPSQGRRGQRAVARARRELEAANARLVAQEIDVGADEAGAAESGGEAKQGGGGHLTG